METQVVGSSAKPPKLMANGEDAKHVKSSKPTISSQERTLAPLPDWSAFVQMQEYNSARHIPPVSSHRKFSVSHPYMWGDQYPAIGSYATQLLNPGSYRLHAIHSHLNAVGGEKISYRTDWEDWDSTRKCTTSLGGVGLVGQRSEESAKTTGSSRIDLDIGSGIASTSHNSNKAKHEKCAVMKKRSFDQMLADEANVDDKITDSANYGGAKHQVFLQGNKLLSMHASKADRGISSEGSSPASKFMRKCPNKPSGASETVASTKMVAREKLMSAQQIQERKEIQATADTLRWETSMHTKRLARYAEMCFALKEENDCLMEELKRMSEANTFSALKAKDPYQRLEVVPEDDDHNQESSDDKSTLTDPSTPDM